MIFWVYITGGMSKKRLILKPNTPDKTLGILFIVLFAIAFIFGIALLVFGKQQDNQFTYKNGVILYEANNVRELRERIALYKYLNKYPLEVEPYLLKSLPKDFSKLPSAERKKLFIKVLIPIAVTVNMQFMQEHQMFEKILNKIKNRETLSDTEEKILEYGYRKYRCHTIKDLLIKSGGVPVSLLIAQAGIESGWGKSRFAIYYNNIYGIHKKHPRPGDIVVHFKSLYDSTVEYILNLDRSPAYKRFRLARYRMGDYYNPYKLAEYLSSYSTRRLEYIKLIKNVLTANNLTSYDKKFQSVIIAEGNIKQFSLE